MDILIASSNEHKISEYKQILKDIPVNIFSLNDLKINLDVEENGLTFKENSFLKAQAAKNKTSYLTISDDSGLIIEALPNILGVHTARFMEDVNYEKRCQKILQLLENETNRRAAFYCGITIIDEANNVTYIEGKTCGTIALKYECRREFGYDPIFIPDGFDKCYSLLDEEVKNKISHRGKASQELINYFKKRGL